MALLPKDAVLELLINKKYVCKYEIPHLSDGATVFNFNLLKKFMTDGLFAPYVCNIFSSVKMPKHSYFYTIFSEYLCRLNLHHMQKFGNVDK